MPARAVRTVGLGKRFGVKVALHPLDLTVEAGEVFGLLGPNGAGKSTAIRMLLGLVRPTWGSASVFGIPVGEVAAAHARLAYVPADVALWPSLTGGEVLELLGAVGPGVDRARRAELVERFALDVSTPSRAYSSGNRQKVALVAAFATRAPLLVLDEPSAGLDPVREDVFRQVVREARAEGRTVLLCSHQLAEVEAVCDRVAILREGRLVEVGGVAGLRGMHRSTVEAVVSGPVPDLADVAGVSDVEVDGARLRFVLEGPPGPALRVLAAAEVTALRVDEPSLEQVFLGFYGARP